MLTDILSQLGQADTYIALASLMAMLVVLDIDNVVFMTLLGLKLPPDDQRKSLRYGLFIGLGTRAILLVGIGYLTALEEPLFTVDLGSYHNEATWQTLITLLGGLFLIGKSTLEIDARLEGPDPNDTAKQSKGATLWGVVAQVSVLNLIFSIDSVITAVGMTNHIWLMVLGTALSMGLVFAFAHRISRFVQKHPTLKVLALAFLLLIGVMLVTEALHVEIPHGYVYFGMAFSLGVELLNIQIKKKQRLPPVQLRQAYFEDDVGSARGNAADELRARSGDDPLQ